MMWINVLYQISRNIASAFIIVFAGFVLAKLLGKLTKRILAEAELNRILKKTGFKPISNKIAKTTEYLIYALTILFALQQLKITTIVLGILLTITISVIIFSIILTCKDFLPNYFAGFTVKKKLAKKIGKHITIGNVKGTLQHIEIVGSTIQSDEKYYVPHKYTLTKINL